MSRPAIVLLASALLASGGCQSSSTNVLGPSGTKCAISLPTNLPAIAAGGGPGTLTVTVAPECVWKASSDAEWISITTNANGQGTGVVGFVAAGNPTASMRRGGVRVGDSRVELAQGGAPCQFNLTPATETFGTDGGESAIAVAVVDGCQWTATSNVPWLSVLGNPSATGSGTIRYRTDANTGSTRSGTLTIADRTFAVNQAGTGAPCALTLGRFEQSVGATGGDDVVVVSSASDCPWTATSHAPWITIAGSASGTGSGVVRLSIAPNQGGLRVGLVTITGHTYIMTQAGATGTCFYSIGATGQSAPAAASAGAVVVSTSSGCAWSAVSQAPWITIASATTGVGSGIVSLAIAANPGAERVGQVTVAGFTYTVAQQAITGTSCSYSINATQLSSPASGATTAVAVTAAGGCNWTAASEVNWIAVTGGASGSGNGTVNLAVAANPGASRSGVVTIAGQTYTVTQQEAAATSCSYNIDATQLSAAASGAATTVVVTAPAGCSWTAASQASWVAVTSGASGSGSGTVSLTVAANSGASRSGVVTIAGQTFTVTQAAGSQSCSYSIGDDQQSVTALGGPVTFGVTAASGCGWTAASQVSWITVASGANGSGNGQVTVTIALNTGAQRVGTVTIAGQTFTVTQAAALLNCSYALSSTDQSSSAAGGTGTVGVTTGGGCGWTAVSQTPWITVTSGATGNGNGSVQLAIAANAGAQRVGTVTIAGHTFTVTQAPAACTYSLDPTTQAVLPLVGGSFTVTITTQAGCSWTAVSDDDWIQLTSPSTGVGSGTLNYRVPLLGLGLSRTGTITISGQVLTVRQALLSNAR